jgi:hypothetical protein
MTPDQEIRAGFSAGKILDDPQFVAAFDAIEASLIGKMRQVPMADINTQHELVLSLQLLGNIKRHFESIIQTGKMAEIQKESLAQKVTKVLRRV